MRPDSLLTWFPAAARYLGLVGIIFMTVVWLVANRIEPALLAMFGSLVGIGAGADALVALSQRPRASREELSSEPGTNGTK